MKKITLSIALALSSLTSSFAGSGIAYSGFPQLETRVLSRAARINETSGQIDKTKDIFELQGREREAAEKDAEKRIRDQAKSDGLTVIRVEFIRNDDEIVKTKFEQPYEMSFKRSSVVRAIIKP